MSASRDPLGAAELEAALEALPGWRLEDGALLRVLPLRAYVDGVVLVQAIAAVAEELDHHPELTLTYGALAVRSSTHLPPGISSLDLELARRVDALAP